jgi:hypothetical protein
MGVKVGRRNVRAESRVYRNFRLLCVDLRHKLRVAAQTSSGNFLDARVPSNPDIVSGNAVRERGRV